MDSDWKHRVDVSSFFLFEATGDSESNQDDSGRDILEVDDNDAESCCSGLCGSMDDFMGFDDKEYYYYYTCSQENESSEEVVMEFNKQEPQAKGVSTGDANENGELLVLNEMEKNKLFWKNCLDS
ncbi:uncharacterized protein LOC122668428 [Telopea speciosissima]|uniref:uncharacterized protein LOC122668428 n=1 Tax=Telopea speciosissima TaxID=54955 RepID=UPI001CC5B7F8|nr:uncharacterized protein LOC122668428 [Telopea speciosissima]